MHNSGHKTILEIVVVTFDLKYVHIKCVIYVTMVFVVTVHYKGKERSEVLSRSFVVEGTGILNFFRPLNSC
jgi:hypothetical protein